MLKRLIGHLFSRPVAFYPILFAAFPVLFLYAYNISIVAADRVIVPLSIAIAASVVVWILLGLLLRDVRKSALATTLLVAVFFSYGYIFTLIKGLGTFVPGHAYMVPILIFIWGYSVYFIKVTVHDFKVLTVILNVVAGVLIIINLFNIGWYQVTRPPSIKVAEQASATPAASSDNLTGAAGPDIYYLILDEYAHPDTMARLYDYKDTIFTDNLTAKGFYIATGSNAPSNLSEVSIAQSLNMEYLPASTTRSMGLDYIRNNKVAGFLKSRGYRFVYIGPYKVPADEYYNFSEYSRSGFQAEEFYNMLISTTILGPFRHASDDQGYENPYRQEVIRSLGQLKTTAASPGKKFVFMHIICPHSYFVFGPNGEYISPENWQNSKDKQYYMGQYIFISRQVDDVIGSILKSSAAPPIIIVQSDHGLRVQPGGGDFIPANEWHKILNAYYLPGTAKELLYPSISPVNSFRLIIDYYFGEKMELLPDQPSPEASPEK